MGYALKYIKALTLLLLCITMLTPVVTSASGGVKNHYNIFIAEHYPGVKPLGMFRNYVIGIEQTDIGNAIVAVNVFNGEKKVLGTIESLGLSLSNLKFWKTENYFMITDNRLVTIWDKNLNQVGRFAQDNLKGVVILPNGDLVAWSNEIVTVAKEPGYVYGKQYDIWNAIYKFFKEERIPPKQLLKMRGIDVDAIEGELLDKLMSEVKSVNGTLIGYNITYSYDLGANTPTEARSKLLVNIVTAAYINNKLYVGVNIEVTVDVLLKATYIVAEENGTRIVPYEDEDMEPVSLGALVILSNETNATIKEIYSKIEAGASSSIMAYVYEPVFPNETYPKILLVLLEDGTVLRVPVYTSSSVDKVYLVDDYEIVHTEDGVTLVYKRDKFVFSFVAQTINDLGITADGRIYIVYVNTIGSLELGLLDRYSGRCDKYTLEIEEKAVGAYVTNELLFLEAEEENGTVVYIGTTEPLSPITINFVDVYGNKIHNILKGKVEIEYKGIEYETEFSSNPLVLSLPVGAYLKVTVDVPYGRATYSYYISEYRTYTYNAVVKTIFTPGMEETSVAAKPFYNPFYREFVMIKDTETLKYRLPGARSIDAYGSVLAMIEATNDTHFSKISLYRIDGVKIYSITLPGFLNEIRIYYPYVVAKGPDRIYVLDLITGTVRGEIDMKAEGYDIDVEQDYFVAWSSNLIAVTDLRRQVTTFLDMSEYGNVVYAPVINGIVYAYVISPNGTSNIYVINVATKGIRDVVPWNGRSVISYASDGIFHAVTYITSNKEIMTDIISFENGLVRLRNKGEILWIRTIGRSVNIPSLSDLKGNVFAAVAMKNGNDIDVYVVGMNYKLVQRIHSIGNRTDVRFSLNFIAVVKRDINATSIIVLKDYSGVSRVGIITSIYPALIAVSENLVAYGDADVVYLIPNPKVIGKYQIEIDVFNDQGLPLNATLYLKEFNIRVKAEEGVFKTYLSTPGVYHIRVSAPYYKTKDVIVGVSDKSPVAKVKVVLEPQLFTLAVTVMTPEKEIVKEGTLTVKGIDVPFEKRIDLAKEVPIFRLRKGTYTIEFTSDIYTSATAQVVVDRNKEVTLIVNRTAVRLTIKVVDETGSPLENASITIEARGIEPIKLTTNELGVASVLLPYGVQFNLTVSKPGYETFRNTYNATPDLEKAPLEITLRKIRGLLTIVVQNEEGKPETATVIIRDAEGNIVQSLEVTGTTTVELDLGTYIIEGTTKDGRTARTTVTLTEESPQATANLIFPKKPAPLYVRIFPYLLIVVFGASVGVIVYRKFFRKLQPRKVK